MLFDLFTFQSGYIQITKKAKEMRNQAHLHSNLVIFKWKRSSLLCESFPFTFQSGYIQMFIVTLSIPPLKYIYIPIWLYSNQVMHLWNLRYCPIYIPIWLYSNLADLMMFSSSAFNLHSNLVIFK